MVGRRRRRSRAAASAAGSMPSLVVGGDRLGRAEAEVAQRQVDGVVPLGADQDADAAASPTRPRSATSQPARRSTSSRPAARQVKLAIVAAGDEADRGCRRAARAGRAASAAGTSSTAAVRGGERRAARCSGPRR